MWLSVSFHTLEAVPCTRASVASDYGELSLIPATAWHGFRGSAPTNDWLSAKRRTLDGYQQSHTKR
ncbi:hypothetical protein E2C01_099390 [Portunus trituberculatus]|uniref:Uncharacterized protein n=1 Tax=Portunus trituberculatus TaxID=210409 RepID=A0A5B7K9H7_PORTR|nr:hypothetical protein [Portunus trituberculatus]